MYWRAFFSKNADDAGQLSFRDGWVIGDTLLDGLGEVGVDGLGEVGVDGLGEVGADGLG